MKVIATILAAFFFAATANCQHNPEQHLLVGNVDCHNKEIYLAATQIWSAFL